MTGSNVHKALALSLIGLLCLCLSACGGASTGTGSQVPLSAATGGADATTASSNITSTHGHLKGDDDMENDDNHKNNDDYPVRDYGYPASAVDRRKVTRLVKRYYSMAAVGNGAVACSLIYSILAEDPSLTKTVPEDRYSARLGPSVSPGETCVQATSRQFKQNHQRLTSYIATLQVTGLRVHGRHGVALLGFGRTPERWITVARERGVWKIDSLLDRELP
jgi:hypothetical protein